MHKLTASDGRTLLVQRDREALAMAARLATPQELPRTEQRPAIGYRLLLLVLRLLLVVGVCLLAFLLFLLVGEERTERVRPDLTPAQRANAFRLPTHEN